VKVGRVLEVSVGEEIVNHLASWSSNCTSISEIGKKSSSL
jgi:hypothetical protein